MRLISVEAMKNLEETGNAAGFPYAAMMQKAGDGIAQFIANRYSNEDGPVLGLVGGGNNGGDTLLTLAELNGRGWFTYALLVKDRKPDDPQYKQFLDSGGRDVLLSEIQSASCPFKPQIILDGISGTGFHPPLSSDIQKILEFAKKSFPSAKWLAVDCPSGVDCSSGSVSEGTIIADVTICLEAVKEGLIKPPAFSFTGEIFVTDLGLEKFSTEKIINSNVADLEQIKSYLPVRTAFSHKGTFGKVLIVGGSVNYTGAPVLSGKAAYAVGAGLVQLAVPESVYHAVSGVNAELTWVLLDESSGVICETAGEALVPYLAGVKSLVVGPGIGRQETTKRFLNRFLFPAEGSHPVAMGFSGIGRKTPLSEKPGLPPLVIDADALMLLAGFEKWETLISPGSVLTPHPGEMSKLTGLPVEQIQDNRLEVAREYASKWKQNVILKGPLTIVASPDGQATVIPAVTSALAKAGTGDVLAGMIGGYIAQGIATEKASLLAVWVHSRAGAMAAELLGVEDSVLASDVIRAIPGVLAALRK